MAGISHKALNGVKENKFKFGDKELQNKEFSNGSGLEMYDFHARNYDQQIGRWISMDRKSEDYFSHSPFAYVANNPTYFVDPTGEYLVIHGTETVDGINGTKVDLKFSVIYENGKTYHYTKDKEGNIEKGEEYKGGNKFVENTLTALDFLSEKNAMEVSVCANGKNVTVNILETIVNDKKNIVSVFETPGGHKAEHEGRNSIKFNPMLGLEFFDNPSKTKSLYNSPASMLGHELAHMYNDLYDNVNFTKRLNTRSNYNTNGLTRFTNEEEEYVTIWIQNSINEKLKEPKRYNYGQYSVRMQSPISNQKEKK